MSWSDENVEELKKLWADGLSCSQIAGRLGGLTRNAVIGKVHRLGLAGRATTSRIKHNRRIGKHQLHDWHKKKPLPKGKPFVLRDRVRPEFLSLPPSPLPVVAEEIVIPLNERKTIATLEKTDCRWPIGHPGQPDFHFCGKTQIPGLPYCEHHVRRAYQPPRPRPPASPMTAPVVQNELEAA